MPALAPETALTVVGAFCNRRVPDSLREQIRLECSRRGNSITISELRPPWNSRFGRDWSEQHVAQLRHDSAAGTWTLYCRRSDDRWHAYDLVGPTEDIVPLVREIDSDPTGIFWG